MRDHAPGPVLILAPIGRDASLAAEALEQRGLRTTIFPDLAALTLEIGDDAGAILVAEEGLRAPDLNPFLQRLRDQEPWSDLPVILLTSVGPSSSPTRLDPSVNVTLLERPLRSSTLLSTIDAALRARIRQWQTRDLIRQRDDAIQSLAVSEERLRIATQAAGVGTWEYRPSSDELFWDAQCRLHLGQRPDTPAAFDTFRACLHPDDLAMVDAAVAVAFEPDGPGTYDVEYRTIGMHDGIERWIAAAGRVFTDPRDQTLRFLGTTIDITARKTADTALREAKAQADAANIAKDRFLATLSHELRTPLTPILMCLSFRATQDDLPPDLQEDLAMIRRNVELEARLIDDMLDLTRVAHGKMELRRETIDCHDLIEATRRICAASPSARKEILIDFEPLATAHHLDADRARLQQIIWNLVQNSVKFSEDGQRVLIRTSNPAPELLEIQVIDHGKGIEANRLSNLFDAFEQGDRGITARYGGLGLGLAIAKALVDLHEGTISAASDGPGRGATFTVQLPALPSPTAPAESLQESADAAARHLRILVVEDDESTLIVLKRLLARAGHTVETAATVAAARQQLDGPPFDLVITDLGLPDGTGHEVIEFVDTTRTATIALSGFGMVDDVERCEALGFTRHLTKPVDWDHLTNTIADVVEKFRQVPA